MYSDKPCTKTTNPWERGCVDALYTVKKRYLKKQNNWKFTMTQQPSHHEKKMPEVYRFFHNVCHYGNRSRQSM